jgi:hypothetical protein
LNLARTSDECITPWRKEVVHAKEDKSSRFA